MWIGELFTMTFFDAVFEVLTKIPEGKVLTYGDVATILGNPRASRAVGYALRHNPMPHAIPCHRIVNREGALARSFAFGGMETQAEWLMEEGVEVVDGKVDLARYRWHYDE